LGFYLGPKEQGDLIFNVGCDKIYLSAEVAYFNQNVVSFSHAVKIMTNKRLANKYIKFPYHIPVRKSRS